MIKKRIPFLDNMRAVAMIMVIGIHSLNYDIGLTNEQDKILFFIFSISVPLFFIVDGYLLAQSVRHNQSFQHSTYIRNSMSRLLIPWVVFSLLYLAARTVVETHTIVPLDKTLVVGRTWTEVMVFLYISVYSRQLYFLPALFLMRSCSLCIDKLLIRSHYFIMVIAFIAYCVFYKLIVLPYIAPHLEIAGGDEPVRAALWGVKFFLMGVLVFRTLEYVDFSKWFLPAVLLCAIVLVLQRYTYYLDIENRYMYIVLFFLFFMWVKRDLKLLTFIGKSTMGIYLIQAPLVIKGVSLVVTHITINPMANYWLIVVGTLVVSLSIVVGISYVPYSSWLFGLPYRPNKAVPYREVKSHEVIVYQ